MKKIKFTNGRINIDELMEGIKPSSPKDYTFYKYTKAILDKEEAVVVYNMLIWGVVLVWQDKYSHGISITDESESMIVGRENIWQNEE